MLSPHRGEGLRAVGGLEQAVPAIAEQRHQVLAVGGAIIDNEDGCHGQIVSFGRKHALISARNTSGSMGRTRNRAAPSAGPLARSFSSSMVDVMNTNGIPRNPGSA